MKKNIIIAAIAAASALLLSVSCQKENQPESQNGINGGANTFTATIEQSLTKAKLIGNKVEWADGDTISINGKIYTASPKDGEATKADFTAKYGEATAVDGKYKAFFPSSLYEAADRFVLPDTLKNNASDNFNVPMYAETESSSQTLSFKNICAVLKINVTETDIAAIKSIKVKADKPLSGEFTISPEGDKAVMDNNGSNEVVLSFTIVQTLTSSVKSFYIAIPAQEYSYLKICLSDDGELYKRAMITKKVGGLGTIDVSTIYEIDYETNAVQLWANGPYWSTMNLGATTETGFGMYFGWGEKTGHALTTAAAAGPFDGTTIPNAFDETHSFSSPNPTIDGGDPNPATLPASNDAATVNWGAAWKMPTGGNSGDFKDLIDNTINAWANNYKGVKGKTFTGKVGTPYSDITLFFPAAGFGNGTDLTSAGTHSVYWSSSLTSETSEKAYSLFFYSTDVRPQNPYFRYGGFLVRPVSD